MAHYHEASWHYPQTEHELWINMPNLARQQEQNRIPEQSAYHSTTNRLSSSSTSSRSSRLYSTIPTISTSADTNKPLPPSPPSAERRKRRSAGRPSMLGRQPTSQSDPSHLQPQPYFSNLSYSVTTTNLSINTGSQHYQAYSRSMPSSPYEHFQPSTTPDATAVPRAQSSNANYFDTTDYLPYNPPTSHQQVETMYPVRPPRSSSMNAYFDVTPPRSNSFPADPSTTPTTHERSSSRSRPHTWLSPTESFSDPSQYSLFAQATTGLPDDSDPWSPNGPPQLQGSLFARRSANDTIPIPLQATYTAVPVSSQQRTDQHNVEPPSFSARSVSAPISGYSQREHNQQHRGPSHYDEVNRELELLGLSEFSAPDDELPDYAQSQAEAHARRRYEASARARELEARWRSTRGR